MYSNDKITKLENIYKNGPYICILNNEEHGDIFMFHDGSFYYYDGEGPWTIEEKNNLQKYIDIINNEANEVIIYISPYIDKRMKRRFDDMRSTLYDI